MSSVKEFIPTPFYKGVPRNKLREIFLSLIRNEYDKQLFHKKKSASQSFDNECTIFQPNQTESWPQNLKLDGYNNLRPPVSLHTKSISYHFNSERRNLSVSANIIGQLSDGKVSVKKQERTIEKKQLPFLKDYMQRIKHELMVNDELLRDRHTKLKQKHKLKHLQCKKEDSLRNLGTEYIYDKEESRQDSYSNKINKKKSDNLNKPHLENYFVDPKQNKQLSNKFNKHFSEFKPIEKDSNIIPNKNEVKNNDFKNKHKFLTPYSSNEKPGKVNLEYDKNLLKEENRSKEIEHCSLSDKNYEKEIKTTDEMRDVVRNDIPVLFKNVRRVVLGINEAIDLNSSKPMSRAKSENLTTQKRKTETELGLHRHHKCKTRNSENKMLNMKQKEKSDVQSNIKPANLQDKVMLSRITPDIKLKVSSKSEPSLTKTADKKNLLNISVPDITKIKITMGSNYLPKKYQTLPSLGLLSKKYTDFFPDINFEPGKSNGVFMNPLLSCTRDLKEESQASVITSKINNQTNQKSESKTNVNSNNFLKWQKLNKKSVEFLEKIRTKPPSNINYSINKQNKYPVKGKNSLLEPDYIMERNNPSVINDNKNLNHRSLSQKDLDHRFTKYIGSSTQKKPPGIKYLTEFNRPAEFEKSTSTSRKKPHFRIKSNDKPSKYNVTLKTNEIYYTQPKERLRLDFGLKLSSENINNIPSSQSNLVLYQQAAFSKNKLKNYNFNTEPNQVKFYSYENKNVENLEKKKSLTNAVTGYKKSEQMNFHPITDTFLESKRAMVKKIKHEQKDRLNSYGFIKPQNSGLYKYQEEDKALQNKVKLTSTIDKQNLTSKRREKIAVNPVRIYSSVSRPAKPSASEKVGKVHKDKNFYKQDQNEKIPSISLHETILSKFLMGKSEENTQGTSYDRQIPDTNSKYNSETFYLQKNRTSIPLYNKPTVLDKSNTKTNPFADQKKGSKFLKPQTSSKFSTKKSSRNNILLKKSSTNKKIKVPYLLFDDEEEIMLKNKFKESLLPYRKENYFGNGGINTPLKSSSYKIGKNEKWNTFIKKEEDMRKFLSGLNSAKNLSRRDIFSRIYGTKSNFTTKNEIIDNSYDSIQNISLSKKVLKDRKTKKHSNFNRFQNKTTNVKNSNNSLVSRNNSASDSKDSIECAGKPKRRNKKSYLSKFLKEIAPEKSKLLINQGQRYSEMFTKKYNLDQDCGSEKEIFCLTSETDAETKQSSVKFGPQDKKVPVKNKYFPKSVSFRHDFQNTAKMKDGSRKYNKTLHRNFYADKNQTPNLKLTSAMSQNAKTKNRYSPIANKVSSKEALNLKLSNNVSKMSTNKRKNNYITKMSLLEMKLPNITYTWDSLLKIRNGKSINCELNSNDYFYNSFLKYKLNEQFRNKIVNDENHIHSKSEF